MANVIWRTEGRLLLCNHVKVPGNSQTKLAREVGVSQPTVSDWCLGKARPEGHHRELLQVVAGIEPDLWQTKSEKKAIGEARARLAEQMGSPARAVA